MRTAKILTVMTATALSLLVLSAPAMAATAHNSQAGSFGSTSNACKATPYFPADTGCLSSYIQRTQDDGVFPPPDEQRARYRPRPPLQ